MAKKIGGIEEDLILVAAIGVGAYLLISNAGSLLPSFLTGGSAASQNTIQQTNTLPPNTNPLSYQYQYGLYGMAPTAYGQSWFQNLKSMGDNNTTSSGGVYDIYVNGEVINNAFGSLVETDGDVDNVFNALTTQADVANIAAYLFFNYSSDLYSLLKNGRGSIPFVSNGLSTDHFAQIINHVNALPVK